MNDGTPRILVVDDEQTQLETVCRGLFLYGYQCTGALDADAAIEQLTAPDGSDFDLMLTDLTMPGSSGIELIEEVRRRWPDLPIVVITGLAASPEVEQVADMAIPLLQKPFEPDTLDQMIRAALRSLP